MEFFGNSCKKLILSGDHLQLPPVVQSPEAKKQGFAVSFLEKMSLKNPSIVKLLNVQYRSNERISGWSSGYFYDGNLKPDSSVAESLLLDLQNVQDSPETRKTLFFVDTKGKITLFTRGN